MMKHLLLTLFVLAFTGTTLSAYDFEVDGIYYDRKSDGTVEVTFKDTNYESYSGNVVIPETVSYNNVNYTVASIGSRAFYDCSGLTGIEIPNTITKIGSEAFYDCLFLTEIEIPQSVAEIAVTAFNFCCRVERMTVDPDNTVYDSREDCNAIIKTESNELLAGCMNTVIPNTVTGIGPSAFRGCHGLTNIEIPNSVNSIGDYAFAACEHLTSIVIPASVTSIGYQILFVTPRLEHIAVEAGNTAYDSRKSCNALIETATNTLLKGCKNSFIPNTVTRIETEAFGSIHGLTSVIIPNSVTQIGESAFSYCYDLTTIEIPESVRLIEDYLLEGSRNVEKIICRWKYPPSARNIWYYETHNSEGVSCYKATKLYVPKGYVNEYKGSLDWRKFENILELTDAGSGDVNGDGKFSIGDVTALINQVLTGGDASPYCDVNFDGRVNISDVTALISWILSGN